MDAKLIFWTGALANLFAIAACGARGVGAIRRGDLRLHRRCMLGAAAGVGAFVLAYAVKLLVLGREDRSAWGALDHAVLYVHETFVAAMLVAGATALFQIAQHRARIDPVAPPPALPVHRRAGRIAAWAGLGALITACGVWAGMLARAGGAM